MFLFSLDSDFIFGTNAPWQLLRLNFKNKSDCCRLIPEKPPAVEKLVSYKKYGSIDMESFKTSAYRKCHSTETALLKVQNDTLMNMDSQSVTMECY